MPGLIIKMPQPKAALITVSSPAPRPANPAGSGSGPRTSPSCDDFGIPLRFVHFLTTVYLAWYFVGERGAGGIADSAGAVAATTGGFSYGEKPFAFALT